MKEETKIKELETTLRSLGSAGLGGTREWNRIVKELNKEKKKEVMKLFSLIVFSDRENVKKLIDFSVLEAKKEVLYDFQLAIKDNMCKLHTPGGVCHINPRQFYEIKKKHLGIELKWKKENKGGE